MDANKLAKAYLKIRDAISEATKKYEEEKAALQAEMDVIEAYFAKTFEDNGDIKSISTPSGTVIRSVKTRLWTSDWESMHKLIIDQGNLDLLERRLAQKNVAAFLEENPGMRPAGLNIDRKYEITVRRK
jgi:hypothetical protein